MAAPNLVSLSTVTATVSTVSLTVNTVLSLVSNAAASATVCRIGAVYVANVNTTTAYNITINYYSAAALGGTAFAIASTVSVAPNSTLLVVSRDACVYLVENSSLGAIASTGNELVCSVFYEVCS